MAIRERQLGTVAYISGGGTSTIELNRDSVYHWFSLGIQGGTWTSVQGAMGTGPVLESNFPFSLIRNIRLIRNGSDVVFQASGAQLAKESYYLNKSHPLARLYTVSSQTETLRTATVRGVTVPANSQGIGSNCGGFTVPDAPASTAVLYFDMQADLYLQLGGVDDSYFSTLLDARPLASFRFEIDWNAESALIATAGTANTSNTVAATLSIMSIDQDNMDLGQPFGTFKRSTLAYNNFTYGSSNNQVILPRGNFYKGVILTTRAYKNGASSSVAAPENRVIGTVVNRINSNFYLRQVDFRQLQAKNVADAGGRQNAFVTAQGEPQGYAYLDYTSAAQKAGELMPTYVMDLFDMQLDIIPSAAQQNGTVAANTNPLIDLLIEEVIPGVSAGGSSPQGAQMGSINPTSAKPYSR